MFVCYSTLHDCTMNACPKQTPTLALVLGLGDAFNTNEWSACVSICCEQDGEFVSCMRSPVLELLLHL